jgi:hypothetical protein
VPGEARGKLFPTIAAPGIFFDAVEWAQVLGEAPITLYRLSVHIWNARWPHFAGPPPSPGHKKLGEKNSSPGGSE